MVSFHALHSQFCEAKQSNNPTHDHVRTPAFAGGGRNPASSQSKCSGSSPAPPDRHVQRPDQSRRHALRLRGLHPRARPGVTITTMVRQVKAQSLSWRRSPWVDSGPSAPAAERGVFAPKWKFRVCDHRRGGEAGLALQPLSPTVSDLCRIWAHRGRPWRDCSAVGGICGVSFPTIRLHGGLPTSSCRPKRKSLVGREVPQRRPGTFSPGRPDACSDLDAAQEAGGRSEGLTFWLILNRFAGSYRRLICANRSKFTP